MGKIKEKICFLRGSICCFIISIVNVMNKNANIAVVFL